MYACQTGHLKSAEAMLPYLQDIGDAHRALAWALRSYQPSVVARILQHAGVDVNAKVEGDTLLFMACGRCGYGTIRSLLDAGADPTILSIDECPPDDFGNRDDPPRWNCLHELSRMNQLLVKASLFTPDELRTLISLMVKEA